jgi:hypothetical protein
VNRRRAYELLAAGTLAISGIAIGLAIAGTVLQQPLGVASSAVCAALFIVPGLYFLGYARRLRTRDVALAHVAAFAAGRGSIRIEDLAEELHVPPAEAERILRTAVREGHLRGRFVAPDRFVAEPAGPATKGGPG